MRAQASPATVSLFEGLPKTLELDIRAEDITEGVRRSCEDCPTALAAARAVGAWGQPYVDNIKVGGITVMLGFDRIEEGVRVTVCYFLSPELAQWIQAFDTQGTVEPIKASLNKCDYHRQDLEEAA